MVRFPLRNRVQIIFCEINNELHALNRFKLLCNKCGTYQIIGTSNIYCLLKNYILIFIFILYKSN